jgi:hypothetical protein
MVWQPFRATIARMRVPIATAATLLGALLGLTAAALGAEALIPPKPPDLSEAQQQQQEPVVTDAQIEGVWRVIEFCRIYDELPGLDPYMNRACRQWLNTGVWPERHADDYPPPSIVRGGRK